MRARGGGLNEFSDKELDRFEGKVPVRKISNKPTLIDSCNTGMLLISILVCYLAYPPAGEDANTIRLSVSLFLCCLFSILLCFSFRRLPRAWCICLLYCACLVITRNPVQTVYFLIASFASVSVASYYREDVYLTKTFASRDRHPVSIADYFVITLAAAGYFILIMLKAIPPDFFRFPYLIPVSIFSISISFIIVQMLSKTPFWMIWLTSSAVLGLMFFATYNPSETATSSAGAVPALFLFLTFGLATLVLLVIPFSYCYFLRHNHCYLVRFDLLNEDQIDLETTKEPELGPLDREEE